MKLAIVQRYTFPAPSYLNFILSQSDFIIFIFFVSLQREATKVFFLQNTFCHYLQLLCERSKICNSNLSLSIVYTDKASEEEEVQKEIVHEQIEVANDELGSYFLWVLYRTVNFICLRTDLIESVKSYHHFVK